MYVYNIKFISIWIFIHSFEKFLWVFNCFMTLSSNLSSGFIKVRLWQETNPLYIYIFKGMNALCKHPLGYWMQHILAGMRDRCSVLWKMEMFSLLPYHLKESLKDSTVIGINCLLEKVLLDRLKCCTDSF